MSLTEVNEGTWSRVTVVPTDSAGDPVEPATASYRIDCIHSQTQVKDWTSLATATSIPITVLDSENVMVDPSAPYEEKEITVEFTDGGGDFWRQRYRWLVRNLAGGTF